MKGISIIMTAAAFMAALLCPVTVRAQKAETVSGTYTYFVDEKANVTFADARVRAVENARVEALKEAFGSMVSSDIVSEMITGSDGTAHTELREITQETARGEWLGDNSEPQVNIRYDSGIHSFVYDVTISGKARKITKSKTELEWKVLCEGTEDKDENDSFVSGEHICVSFKSPVSGYVAVYLMGDDGEVSCLLPYPGDQTGAYAVRGGKRYVFFDKESDPSAYRYRLKTDRPVENNVVYVIFSQNPFTRCVDEKADPGRPNYLSVKAFEKWRAVSMQHDDRMNAEKRWVKITNN